MTQGYPLRGIGGFAPRVLSTLRDPLSVTTAEEFRHRPRGASGPGRDRSLAGAAAGRSRVPLFPG
jgi:hypothetical protein